MSRKTKRNASKKLARQALGQSDGVISSYRSRMLEKTSDIQKAQISGEIIAFYTRFQFQPVKNGDMRFAIGYVDHDSTDVNKVFDWTVTEMARPALEDFNLDGCAEVLRQMAKGFRGGVPITDYYHHHMFQLACRALGAREHKQQSHYQLVILLMSAITQLVYPQANKIAMVVSKFSLGYGVDAHSDITVYDDEGNVLAELAGQDSSPAVFPLLEQGAPVQDQLLDQTAPVGATFH